MGNMCILPLERGYSCPLRIGDASQIKGGQRYKYGKCIQVPDISNKGSKNRGKARVKVARLHEHIANCRLDASHKLSTKLVRENDLIALEALRVGNMIRNRRLVKSIADAGWAEFVRQVKYKAGWYGKEVVQVGAFFPSNQTCSRCGYRDTGVKSLAVREWDCPGCGAHHDRDQNAAASILRKGLKLRGA